MTCGKSNYPTKFEALKDVKFIRSQQLKYSKRHSASRKNGRKLRPYLCSKCGLWHLTSRGERKYDKT